MGNNLIIKTTHKTTRYVTGHVIKSSRLPPHFSVEEPGYKANHGSKLFLSVIPRLSRLRREGGAPDTLITCVTSRVASFPSSCVGEEEREPSTHCLRMHQVPLVTCILLRYTKVNGNFCLPAERPHCRIILPMRHLRAVLKSETISIRR